jgi:predicted nucleic acid-binding protein
VKVLLDTNIIAELVKPIRNPAVKAALDEIPTADLFLSVLTVGEIVNGIALLPPVRRRNTSRSGSPVWKISTRSGCFHSTLRRLSSGVN